MQQSVTLNQVKWFKVKDIDDCWVLSSLQLVHAVAPWLYLVNTETFRAAAGDPDDGSMDGGNVAEIVRGIGVRYPSFVGKLRPLRKAAWTELVSLVDAGRPASVSVISSLLPARVRFGFDGAHQVTIARSAAGTLALANPLAPVYSRWAEVTWAEIKAAIMQYGKARSGGTLSVYAVVGPTELEMLPTHPLFAQAAAASQADLLEAARKEGFNTALTDCAAITTSATAQIEALRKA